MPELPTDLLALCNRQRGAASGRQIAQFLAPNEATRCRARGQLVRLWRGAYALPDRAGELETRLFAADLTLNRSAIPCLHTAAAL